MDHLGDHATDLCHKGIGCNNSHSTVTRILAPNAFKAAGLTVQYEVRNLVTCLDIRPADLLVHRPTPLTSGQSVPIEFDVTGMSAFRTDFAKLGARKAYAVADATGKRKIADLANKVVSLPNDSPPNDVRLGWVFVPFAFDSLGAPSTTTLKVEEEHAKRVVIRCGCSYGHVKQSIFQKFRKHLFLIP